MNLLKLLFSLLIGGCFLHPLAASASTWNWIKAVKNNDAVFFFDAESVSRNRDEVVIWFKSVQKRQLSEAGAWATAMQYRFLCKERMGQALAYSDYDAAAVVIRSRKVNPPLGPIPSDSIGAALFRVACKPDFPNSTAGIDYQKLIDNDVYAKTRELVRYENDLAPR